jgi:hypothetical protein
MADVFSPNKGFDEPATGSYPNTWGPVLNADFATIDTCFGGLTQINVTGVAPGIYTLQLSQYQPPNIVFNGVLTGDLAYTLPLGVGGIWSVYNNTSGAFSLFFASNSGSTLALTQGQRTLLVCDGANVQYADGQVLAAILSASAFLEAFATNAANTAQANAIAAAESFAASAADNAQAAAAVNALAVAANAQTAAEGFATSAANTAQSAAQIYAAGLIRSGSFSCTNGTVTVTFSTPFPTACTSVMVQWEFESDVGYVATGSRNANGFQYVNGNAGLCTYTAIGH